jgi:hypothetical protein
VTPTDQVLRGFRAELEKLAAPVPMPAPMADMVQNLSHADIDAISNAVHNRLAAAGMNSADAAQASKFIRATATKAWTMAKTPAELEGAKATIRQLLESVEQAAPVHRSLKFDRKTGTNIESAVHQQFPKGHSPLVRKMRSFVGMKPGDLELGHDAIPDKVKEVVTNLRDPKYLEREGRRALSTQRMDTAKGVAKTEGLAVRDAYRKGGLREGGEAAIDAAKRGFGNLPTWGKIGVGAAGLVGLKSALSEPERPRGIRLEVR